MDLQNLKEGDLVRIHELDPFSFAHKHHGKIVKFHYFYWVGLLDAAKTSIGGFYKHQIKPFKFEVGDPVKIIPHENNPHGTNKDSFGQTGWLRLKGIYTYYVQLETLQEQWFSRYYISSTFKEIEPILNVKPLDLNTPEAEPEVFKPTPTVSVKERRFIN